MNVAPVSVTAPDGTVYEPVRAEVVPHTADDGPWLVVTDRDGEVLATTHVMGPVMGGRRKRSVESVEGTWRIDDICGCSSAKHALLREWRGVPAREGT